MLLIHCPRCRLEKRFTFVIYACLRVILANLNSTLEVLGGVGIVFVATACR
jgi:hypothetical protein